MLASQLLLLVALTPPAIRQAQPVRDLYPDTWAATDGLGRSVAMGKPGETIRTDRTVGMFYFLANHAPGAPVFDNTKILAANPFRPQYGPFGSAHWWGEPWFGYYQSDDRAVIRKHMEMLANAGVDVIVFDNTNGPTYPDVYVPLCQVLEEMKAQGVRAPQIAFFTGHGAWSTLYRDLYLANLYPDLWFRWKGRPLMMVHLETGDRLPPEIPAFFTVRESWAWTPSEWFGDGHDKWPWLDNFPQNYGWHEDPKRPEEMSVVVGQHATSSIGRSSLAQHEPPVDDLRCTPFTPIGRCFAQQFERAIAVDPEFIFVTGWNEWTATRFEQTGPGTMAGKPVAKGGSFFVDEYNAEFSRDIEPAKGVTSDNYYYQLVDFIRRYKGARPVPPVTRKRIDIRASFAQWSAVGPEFRDAVGDPMDRDHPGWADLRYTNKTGHNDIVAAKVAYDDKFVTFYVRTQNPLTMPLDAKWMLLFLRVPRTGPDWLGYNAVVNRQRIRNLASLDFNQGGGYRWGAGTGVAYRASGNELMVQVPRAELGLAHGPATIDFKWADNAIDTGDPSDFTLNGDVAPDDRFNYRAIIGR